MKTPFLFSVVISLFFYSGICFSQQWKWVSGTGGNSFNEGHALDVDKFGNVFQAGSFTGTISLGNSTFKSFGEKDIFISKYNFEGDHIWSKSAGGTKNDYPAKIKISSDKSFFVTGSFSGTCNFDNYTVISKGEADIFIAKYSEDGELLWAKSAGGNGKDEVFGLTLDEENNAYITGATQSNLFLSSGKNIITAGQKDLFIVKYDAFGNLTWVKVYGGVDSEYGSDIYCSGKFLTICGQFEGTGKIGNFTLNSKGKQDFFIARLDTTGNTIWASSFGSKGDDYISAIAISYYEEIYCAGTCDLSYINDSVPNESPFTPIGKSDAFLLKLDHQGKKSWVKTVGGINDDSGNSISIDAKNRIFLSGKLSPDGVQPEPSSGNTENYNSFIAQFDEDGSLIFARATQGAGGDEISGIISRSGNIYFTGKASSETNFESIEIKNKGAENSFTGRFSLQSKKPVKNGAPPLKIGMFPNPATTNVNILFQPDLEDIFKKIEILNEQDEVVKKDFVSGRYINIKTKGLSSGNYTLKIETEDQINLYELIIK